MYFRAQARQNSCTSDLGSLRDTYACVHCPLETIPYSLPCQLGYVGRGGFEPKESKVVVTSADVHFGSRRRSSSSGSYHLRLQLELPDLQQRAKLTFVGTYTLLPHVGRTPSPPLPRIRLQFDCMVLAPRGKLDEWMRHVAKRNHGIDDMGSIVYYKDYQSTWHLLHVGDDRAVLWTPEGRLAYYVRQ